VTLLLGFLVIGDILPPVPAVSAVTCILSARRVGKEIQMSIDVAILMQNFALLHR
jgi:hypothetical protein